MKTLCITLLLSTLLCGCNAAKQSASTPPPPPPPATTPVWTLTMTENDSVNMLDSTYTYTVTFVSSPCTATVGDQPYYASGSDCFIAAPITGQGSISPTSTMQGFLVGSSIDINTANTSTVNMTGTMAPEVTEPPGLGIYAELNGTVANGTMSGTWTDYNNASGTFSGTLQQATNTAPVLTTVNLGFLSLPGSLCPVAIVSSSYPCESAGVGISEPIQAFAFDQRGALLNPQPTFTWSSDNTLQLQDQSGTMYVTGNTAGTAEVTARAGNVSGSTWMAVVN